MRRILVIISICIFIISSLSGCSKQNLNSEVLNKPVENIFDNEDKNKISAKSIFLSTYNLAEFKDYKLEEGTEYLEKIDPENYYLKLYDSNGVLLESLSNNILNRLNSIARIFDGKYSIAPVELYKVPINDYGFTIIEDNNSIQGINHLNIPYVLVEDDVFMKLVFHFNDYGDNKFKFSFDIEFKSDQPIKESIIIDNLYKNNLVNLISYYPYDEEDDEEYYEEISNCIKLVNDRWISYKDDKKQYHIGHRNPDENAMFGKDFYTFEYSYYFYIDYN